MYMEHFIGEKIRLINFGEVPKKFLETVSEVRKRLNSSTMSNKTATFLFGVSPTEPAKPAEIALVAISGHGNAHRTADAQSRLNGLITFVPYLEAMPEDDSSPTDPRYDFDDEPDRRMIFNRFMIFATNAIKKDGSCDEEFVRKFHMTPLGIDALKLIKEYLALTKFKEQYVKFRQDNEDDTQDKNISTAVFLSNIAWQCYRMDISLPIVIKKLGGSLTVTNAQTDKPIEKPALVYQRYLPYISELGLSKPSPCFDAFKLLWDHCQRFTIDALTKKMQHCAETNLIARLEDKKRRGDDIFLQPLDFYIFSTNMAMDDLDVKPLCDNCAMRSLPDLIELNTVDGIRPRHSARASIPVRQTSPETISQLIANS